VVCSRPPGLAPAAAAALLVAGLASGCGELKRWAYSAGDRDEWQQPERVVEALAIEPGDAVADLGAGGGYFTFRLAEAVGPEGRVYAVDVDPDMLSHLEERAREEGHAQVEVVRAEATDPKLPEPVDLILTVNTYHHLPAPTGYFREVRRYLRPDGRIAVIELSGRSWLLRWLGHWTAPEEIRAEMQAAGYVRVADRDFLERQSFQVFAPTALAGEGRP